MANTGLASQLLKPARQWLTQKLEPKFKPLPVPAFNQMRIKELARGSIVQILGGRSSGRSAVSLHILAQATQRGEFCAVVDLQNALAPGAALAAGVCLERLLWVRCGGNPEHAMRAADLLVHAGGFGVVLLDLCDASAQAANRIPLSYWFRFQRAVEDTPSILLVCGDRSYAQGCSGTTLELHRRQFSWTGEEPFLLLRGIETTATVSHRNQSPSTGPMPSVA